MEPIKPRRTASAANAPDARRTLYEDDDGGDDFGGEAGSFPPMVVLARIPNLSGPPSQGAAPESAGTYRLLGDLLSFRLLAGTAIVLLIAAIAPYVISKWKSLSHSSATSGRPAWQPEVPAPTADAAPPWNPSGAVALSHKQSDQAGGAVETGIAPAATGLAANPANLAGGIDGRQNASTGSGLGVNPPTAARSPLRVAEALRASPASDQAPLDWGSFSRRFDQQQAPAASPLPPYRNGTTNTGPVGGSNCLPPAGGGAAAQPSANNSMILNQDRRQP